MQDTVGKRLCSARLARGLTIDEAAHETRMRPDKILALENDDFSRFGSNAYAKGFLLIYSRLLNVDVTEEARLLDTPHDIRVRDYQYLNNAEAPAPQRFSRFTQRQNKPSIAPLIVFLVIVLVSAFVFYLVKNFQRLDSSGQKPPLSQAPPGEVQTPAEPVVSNTAVPDSTPAEPAPEAPKVAEVGSEPAPAIKLEGEPVPATDPVPVAATADAAVEPAPETEITVGVKKKTKVTIREDDPKATPKFSDYIYPKDPPLKFRGVRLFIEIKNPELLEVRRNGEPVAYKPGTPIQ
ncbi:MAG: hypothetical protein JWL59_1697 [Chthoniobacteraceae bacterium]|nr:hypothetical protein [Chthoniobacteraceae bacterium]